MRRPEENDQDALSAEEELELLVESYLDGQLGPEETALFERRLLEPAVAKAFGEALMLRALLADMPPDQAPEELMASLEAALVADVRLARKAARMPRLRAALTGMSWMVGGPAQAVQAASAASNAQPTPMRGGLSTMRYALGPLAVGNQPKAPSKPLWRRLLARGLRRKPTGDR